MSTIYEESTINDMYFTTKKMKHIFSDANKVQKQMDCEAALAATEAEFKIIPQSAAEEIIKKSQIEYIDFTELKRDLIRTGHPFVALVSAYKKICDGNAGEYVHWGATTQDILDTSVALQLKEAYEVIMQKAEILYKILAQKAFKYKDLVMVGRTNGQHAMPITLGYKLAVWGFEMRDNIDRLHQAEKRFFKGEFAGAVGTMASLGTHGLQVQEGFLKKLGLYLPEIAWSSSRNHYAELVSNLAILASTMGKIGTEVYTLQKSEIQELEEQQGDGAVGSSTMPHKRNPFRSMELSTNSKIVRGYADMMLNSLETEHERDPRSASVENHIFEEVFSVVDASLDRAINLIDKLIVHPKHMKKNLGALHGLIFSEALMMALGKKMGRQSAHKLIHTLSMQAFESEISLLELLKQDKTIMSMLTIEEIKSIMNPENYTGKASFFAEKLKKQMDKYFA